MSNFVDSIQNNYLSIFLVRSDPGDESEERVRRDSGSWKSALTSRAFASRPRRRPFGRPPPKDERHRREETGDDFLPQVLFLHEFNRNLLMSFSISFYFTVQLDKISSTLKFA